MLARKHGVLARHFHFFIYLQGLKLSKHAYLCFPCSTESPLLALLRPFSSGLARALLPLPACCAGRLVCTSSPFPLLLLLLLLLLWPATGGVVIPTPAKKLTRLRPLVHHLLRLFRAVTASAPARADGRAPDGALLLELGELLPAPLLVGLPPARLVGPHHSAHVLRDERGRGWGALEAREPQGRECLALGVVPAVEFVAEGVQVLDEAAGEVPMLVMGERRITRVRESVSQSVSQSKVLDRDVVS